MVAFEIAEPLRSVLPALRERFRAEGWWGDETFASRGERWAAERPEAVALADDTRAMTWAGWLDEAKRLAAALIRRGVGPRSVVGLQLPNSAHYGVANLACELAGAVWVNLSRAYTARELIDICTNVRVDTLVVPSELFAELRAALPALAVTVAVDEGGAGDVPTLASLVAEPRDDALVAAARLAADDIYSIALSSGTTSARPKDALRSVNSMLSALSIMNRDLGIGPDDRIMVLAPQTGGTGYSFSVAHPLITGARADVTELPIGAALAARIARLQPTVLVAVPTQMGRLLDEAGGDRSMWAALRLIINSGAPLLGDVAARAEESCGCPIVSVYGATDGMVPVMSSPSEPAAVRHTSVGRVIAGHRLRIVDEADHDVAPGEIGEICGFGPGMAFGYVDNPGEMARAWDAEGWWHSGDLGVLDDTGHLRVVGRKKEMILRGGLNISPLEIEEVLGTHPDVAEVAVVPMPHPQLLEQACAFVVLRRPRGLTLRDVTQYLTEQGLAKTKQPERLEIRSGIPRTAAQKIDKLALRAEIAALIDKETRP